MVHLLLRRHSGRRPQPRQLLLSTPVAGGQPELLVPRVACEWTLTVVDPATLDPGADLRSLTLVGIFRHLTCEVTFTRLSCHAYFPDIFFSIVHI